MPRRKTMKSVSGTRKLAIYRKPKSRLYRSMIPNYLRTERSYVMNISPVSYPFNQIITPNLESLSSAAEFTELFEQYRCNYIRMRWIPNQDYVTTLGQANAIFYVTTSARRGVNADYDTENEYLEDPKYKCFKANRPFRISYVPNTLIEQYESTATTGYTPSYKQWLTTNDKTVPLYGFHMYGLGFPSNPASGTSLGRWLITLGLEFKGVH